MSYTFDSPLPQKLNEFPRSYWKYIEDNYSADTYQKLIRTCKYLFARSRIIVLDGLHLSSRQITTNVFNQDQQALIVNGCRINLKLMKLWIKDYLHIDTKSLPRTASALLKHVARNDIKVLTLEDQILMVDEFTTLTHSVESLCLFDTAVSDSNSTLLSIGDVLTMLPQIEDFEYAGRHESQSYDLRVSQPLRNLKMFTLTFSPNLNPREFCQFAKLHPGVIFSIWFFDQFEYMEIFKDAILEMFPKATCKPHDIMHQAMIFEAEGMNIGLLRS